MPPMSALFRDKKLVMIRGGWKFVDKDPKRDFLEIDEFPEDPFFYPYQLRAVKDRLARYPGFGSVSPYEREAMRKLAAYMRGSVASYLKKGGYEEALYEYIHDSDVYQDISRYAAGFTDEKPPYFDEVQRVLHSKGLNRGSPLELVLYRSIGLGEMQALFDNFDPDTQNGPFYVNRNVSTSVSPMVALNFLDKEDSQGPRCCLLVFRVPRGFPVIYMPGLFKTSLVREEREVLLPSGLYVPEVLGVCIGIDPKKLRMQSPFKTKPFHVRVVVLTPYETFSPFLRGPREQYAMDHYHVPVMLSPEAKRVMELLHVEEDLPLESFSPKEYEDTGKELGGSTGARLVRGKDGRLHVWKKGASPGQALVEAVANELYRAAGVPVPVVRYSNGDGLLTEFVPGVPLRDLKGGDRKVAVAALRRHFLIDAVLANWDVLGMDLDNVIVPEVDGRLALDAPVRIDNGGSLDTRAQGGKKPFGAEVLEIDTMRKKDRHGVFRGLTDADLAKQYTRLNVQGAFGGIDGATEALADGGLLPPELAETILERVGDVGVRLREEMGMGRTFAERMVR